MEPTNDGDQSAANGDTRIVDNEEEKEENSVEVEENVSMTTTTTTKPSERPSCMNRSSAIKTDDSFLHHHEPLPPPIKDGLTEEEEDKKQDSRKMIIRCDTQLREVMVGGAHPPTCDSTKLPPLEGKHKPRQELQSDDSCDSGTRQDSQELPTTSSTRTRRSHPNKRPPNTDPSSSTACMPTPTPPEAATSTTATRRRIKGAKTSGEHGRTCGTATKGLQGMNIQASVQHPTAASSTTPSNVNHGNENGSRFSGSAPPQKMQHRQQEQHLDNRSGALSVTMLSLADQPCAFGIRPNGSDGVHNNDDDETMVLYDVENAVATPSCVQPPDNTTVATSSAEAHLPIAQSLEDDAVEREVLDRVLSRQPVVQAETIPPPSHSNIKLWVPLMISVGLISALLVTLVVTGVLFPNRMDDIDLPLPSVAAPPSIADSTATTVDVNPILQWIEPFLTNRSYSIPTEPTSAQYRAIEWLAEYHPPSNGTTKENMDVWIQYYALVTFYYSTGGESGKWSIDRLWLTSEPLCSWTLISCFDYTQNATEKPANFDDHIYVTGLNAGTLYGEICCMIDTFMLTMLVKTSFFCISSIQ
jgi:hypothetical protein